MKVVSMTTCSSYRKLVSWKASVFFYIQLDVLYQHMFMLIIIHISCMSKTLPYVHAALYI